MYRPRAGPRGNSNFGAVVEAARLFIPLSSGSFSLWGLHDELAQGGRFAPDSEANPATQAIVMCGRGRSKVRMISESGGESMG